MFLRMKTLFSHGGTILVLLLMWEFMYDILMWDFMYNPLL